MWQFLLLETKKKIFFLMSFLKKMPKSKKLFIFEHDEIVGLHKGERNSTDISKILNISRMTINDIINKWEKDESVSSAS